MAEIADIDLAPISDEAPCGPDLDAAGDLDFMNFLAANEGQLPEFLLRFRPQRRSTFPPPSRRAAELKKRTQDLRLILLVAKLAVLNRDFYRFAQEVAEIAWLLANRWDSVHPQAEQGEYISRLAQLGTLDDSPAVVLPLQYATILQTEREGPLVYRAVMAAAGEVKPREGEKLASAGVIERMLTTTVEIEALTKSLRDASANWRASLEAITADHRSERVDPGQAVKFDTLSPLVEKMLAFAQAALARRDPSLAPAVEAAGSEAPTETPGGTATFESLADVDGALASALGYFQAKEPSSPALLLIVQARATLGKNLYEVIRLLAPRHVDNARVFVGPSDAFSIPVKALEDAPALDFSRGDAAPAETRAQALALIEKVASHLRSAEPSSPAPYLLDRARALATRDFLSLLGEVFPARRPGVDGQGVLSALLGASASRPTMLRPRRPGGRRSDYLRELLRNVVQSGEPPVSISTKLTACKPRRQQSEMP